MLKATIVLWVATLCSAAGSVLMSKGMQLVGPLEDYRPASLARFVRAAVSQPYVLLGVAASTVNFFLWLVVLSWAEVSWALPMNAVEYIVVALMAVTYLKERISARRWIGIGLIAAGVLCVMESWR